MCAHGEDQTKEPRGRATCFTLIKNARDRIVGSLSLNLGSHLFFLLLLLVQCACLPFLLTALFSQEHGKCGGPNSTPGSTRHWNSPCDTRPPARQRTACPVHRPPPDNNTHAPSVHPWGGQRRAAQPEAANQMYVLPRTYHQPARPSTNQQSHPRLNTSTSVVGDNAGVTDPRSQQQHGT